MRLKKEKKLSTQQHILIYCATALGCDMPILEAMVNTHPLAYNQQLLKEFIECFFSGEKKFYLFQISKKYASKFVKSSFEPDSSLFALNILLSDNLIVRLFYQKHNMGSVAFLTSVMRLKSGSLMMSSNQFNQSRFENKWWRTSCWNMEIAINTEINTEISMQIVFKSSTVHVEVNDPVELSSLLLEEENNIYKETRQNPNYPHMKYDPSEDLISNLERHADAISFLNSDQFDDLRKLLTQLN